MRKYTPRYTSRESDTTEITIAKKGSSTALSIDYKAIDKIVAKLRKHHTTSVNEPKYKNDIVKLNEYVQTLYHTNAYETFYSLIVKHFSDLKTITPGTIGAHCYGCNYATAFGGDQACNALCAGGIPPPKLPQWASCAHNVVLLHLSRHVSGQEIRSYQILNHAPSSTHTYVFVLRDASYVSEGSGIPINDADIKKWHPIVTRTYHLFEYKEGDYKDLSGLVKVNVSSTSSSEETIIVAEEPDQEVSGGVLLIVILLLLVIILLGYAYHRTRTMAH